jgi:phosphomannomutase
VPEVYQSIGEVMFERIDLHPDEADKLRIMQNCSDDKYKSFGSYKVESVENIDGYKYYFAKDEWVMIRPSGTEPVLRTYAESKDTEGAFKILEEVHKTIKGS